MLPNWKTWSKNSKPKNSIKFSRSQIPLLSSRQNPSSSDNRDHFFIVDNEWALSSNHLTSRISTIVRWPLEELTEWLRPLATNLRLKLKNQAQVHFISYQSEAEFCKKKSTDFVIFCQIVIETKLLQALNLHSFALLGHFLGN